MSSRNLNGLTVKQQTFCDLYRGSDDDEVRGNAKRCYMIAYTATAKSAEANGPRLLKDPHVSEYLEQKRIQAEEKVDISEERILRELSYMAFLDPKDYRNEDGSIKNIHDMPEGARRALASIETNTAVSKENDEVLFVTHKIKHYEKNRALELLMKEKGMLKEKVEHSGGVGGVLLVPNDMSPEEWQKQNASQPQT